MSRSLLAFHAPSVNASALSVRRVLAVGGMKPPNDSLTGVSQDRGGEMKAGKGGRQEI